MTLYRLGLLMMLLLPGTFAGCGASLSEVRMRDQRITELEQDRSALLEEKERLRAREGHLSELVQGLAANAGTVAGDRDALRRDLEQAQGALGELSESQGEALSDASPEPNLPEGGERELPLELSGAHRALEEVRARERQTRARIRTFRALLDQLRNLEETSRLRVHIVRNRMVVDLPEAALFDGGGTEINAPGRDLLSQVAPVLVSLPHRTFQVGGHTDAGPTGSSPFPSMWELSTARAVAVTRLLIEQGVPAERVSAAGYADTQPNGDEETDEGRLQNRRVEIVLLPNLEELPDLSTFDGFVAP